MAQTSATQLLDMFNFPRHPLQTMILKKLSGDANAIAVVIFVLVAFNLRRIFMYYRQISDFVGGHWKHSITIDRSDDSYDALMSWVSDHNPEGLSKALSAKTIPPTVADMQDQLLRIPRIRLIPAVDNTFYIRHNGKLICVRRDTDNDSTITFGNGMKAINDKEVVTLWCYGTSHEPLKNFLDHIVRNHCTKNALMTNIRKPSSNYYGRDSTAWSLLLSQPKRPMESVHLDNGQKERIIDDMKNFLKSEERYNKMGMPHRRCYMFHGPPGTGKTSFILALAGHFGLDVCILNLKSCSDDEQLLLLVAKAQECIVLIEDIDSAGLAREQKADSLICITLAGLLNAIDGIASSNGRVLIMTTNRPSTLDPAILRPGRVDVKEHFGKATKQIAQDMFMRMCSKEKVGDVATTEVGDVATTEVGDLANKFVKHIDDKRFSPAELQGFLQQRPDPVKACSEISGWVKANNLKCEGEVQSVEGPSNLSPGTTLVE